MVALKAKRCRTAWAHVLSDGPLSSIVHGQQSAFHHQGRRVLHLVLGELLLGPSAAWGRSGQQHRRWSEGLLQGAGLLRRWARQCTGGKRQGQGLFARRSLAPRRRPTRLLLCTTIRAPPSVLALLIVLVVLIRLCVCILQQVAQAIRRAPIKVVPVCLGLTQALRPTWL